MKLHLKQIVLSLLILLSSGSVASAASFFTSTTKPTVGVNETFSVTVFVDTEGKAINSADAVLSFPTDLLSVESVNKTSSIFSMWIKEPNFSNTLGTISLEGGLPTPGYTGTSGRVMQVQFRAKKAGVASVDFSNANIYANDGLGTNVLNQKRSAVVTITSAVVPVVQDQSLPSLPKISSKEIVDSNLWYGTKQATFTWNIPSGVNAVQLLRGSHADSIPTVTYSPAIAQKTITDIEDGVWYLHVRFRGVNGWGPTAHKKIKIDNTSPTNLEVTSRVLEQGEVVVNASAKDSLSGIKSYELFIDGESKEKKDAETLDVVEFKTHASTGKHTIEVKVFDQAGNTATKTVDVEIVSEAVELSVAKDALLSGESLEITGKASPNALLNIVIESTEGLKKVASVIADEMGLFKMVTKDISPGKNTVYAELTKENLNPVLSNKVFVQMDVPESHFSFDLDAMIQALSAIIPVFCMIFTLFFVILVGIRWIIHLVKHIPRKSKELPLNDEETLKNIFTILKNNSKSGAVLLSELKSTYKITEKDIKAMNELSQSIEALENYFAKKINFKK